jgi:hypothetical protein
MKSITEIKDELERLAPVKSMLWEQLQALETPYCVKRNEWYSVSQKMEHLELLLEAHAELNFTSVQ